MFTTHQQIVDARQKANRAINEARELLHKEQAEHLRGLQEQCGALGHIYAYPGDFARALFARCRTCAICDADEPTAAKGA